MSDQIDINRVLQKMQSRLSEAMTTNAVLEAHVDQLQERLAAYEAKGDE